MSDQNKNPSGQARAREGVQKESNNTIVTLNGKDASGGNQKGGTAQAGGSILGGTTEAPTGSNTGVQVEYLGVKAKKTGAITWGLHWVTLTVETSIGILEKLYKDTLQEYCGQLIQHDYSMLKGYKKSYQGKHGLRIHSDPTTHNKRGSYEYCTMVIPGAACETIPIENLRKLYQVLKRLDIGHKCTRLDYKHDYVPMSPHQAYYLVKNDAVKLTGKRVKWFEDDGLDEEGNRGSATLYLGSRGSGRMMRVYDVHGYTRLEMENRREVAGSVWHLIMSYNDERIPGLLNSLICDYVYIDHAIWREYVGLAKGAKITMPIERNRGLDQLKNTAALQWASGISILFDVLGQEYINQLIDLGRGKRHKSTAYMRLIHELGLDDGETQGVENFRAASKNLRAYPDT